MTYETEDFQHQCHLKRFPVTLPRARAGRDAACSNWRRGAAAVMLATGMILALPKLLIAEIPHYPAIFESVEWHSDNLIKFPKWTGVLRRHAEDMRRCAASGCDDEGWREFIDSLRDYDIMTQIRAVNTWLNRVPYIADIDNKGVIDHWATPLEFLRNGGDCEDYAVAKYIALRELGISAEMMRIVVLMDLDRGLPHAVLVVYANSQPYLLDSLRSGLVRANANQNYQPAYSINEGGWWLHVPMTVKKWNWATTAAASSKSNTMREQLRARLK